MSVKIRVVTVGKQDTPTEALRRELEAVIQGYANQDWTMRGPVSRGGTIYLVFAKKVKL